MSVPSEFAVRDTRQPGHFWADNEVLDLFGERIGVYGFAVYMVLCRHARNGTGEVRISVRGIASVIAINHSTVIKALDKLLELRLVLKLSDGDRRTPATYALADIKALTDPEYRQLKLAGPEGVVATQPLVVTTQPHVVYQATTVVATQPRNKESKTLSRLNTKTRPSPTPPASQEGLKNLTSRERKKLNDLVQGYMRSHLDEFGHARWENGKQVQPMTRGQAIEAAAKLLLVPHDAALAAFTDAGLVSKPEDLNATL